MRFAIPKKLSIAAVLLAGSTVSLAGVLPDDRADALFHRYDGGGVTIQGPSLLVRKKFKEKYAFSTNYYVDMVSSASIDVQTSGASEYKEKRTQYSFGADYLNGKSTYSFNYINSRESDYAADTASFTISQDMFGDLTTVSLGVSRGWNTVMRNVRQPGGELVTDPNFSRNTDMRQYRLGLSQILTRNLIVGLNYEVITDEGFLNNPYRSVRYLDAGSATGWSRENERYPRTHTSNAVAVTTSYYLPYRAALHGMYRYFTDTWGVRAMTAEVGYTHPLPPRWLFEGSFRFYSQTRADFYSDLFERANFQNFLARDKELSTFDSQTFGLGVTYEFPDKWKWPRKYVQRGTLNFRFDHILFNYDDFRDARVPGVTPGTEPLYTFDANVLQLFVSLWY